jgi:hypothetical protein
MPSSGPLGASGSDEPAECGLVEPIVDLGTRQLKKNLRMHSPSRCDTRTRATARAMAALYS